jgi:formylglycine-generating enzyme required for sulfatase activity
MRFIHGGSWYYDPLYARAWSRGLVRCDYDPSLRVSSIGFRCVRRVAK